MLRKFLMTQRFLAWVTLHRWPWLRESEFEHSMRSSTSPSGGTVLFETSTATWPVSGRIHDVWHFLRLGVETVQLTVSPRAQSTTHSSLASFQDWPLVCMRSSLCSLGFVLVFLEQRTCPRSPGPGSWTDPGQVPVDLPGRPQRAACSSFSWARDSCALAGVIFGLPDRYRAACQDCFWIGFLKHASTIPRTS